MDKNLGVKIGSASSVLTTGTGVALMFLPPYGTIAGSMLLGSGI